jgi:hypothetical protein
MDVNAAVVPRADVSVPGDAGLEEREIILLRSKSRGNKRNVCRHEAYKWVKSMAVKGEML